MVIMMGPIVDAVLVPVMIFVLILGLHGDRYRQSAR
jgi:hypothetical protein